MAEQDLKVLFASAETLLNSAAELVLDASSVLNDAGDSEAVQAVEALTVAISVEVEALRKKRQAIEAAA